MRPVGGSATEAPDGGVGARGGNSGGVAPAGTAKTGVKVASAAGQNGAESMCIVAQAVSLNVAWPFIPVKNLGRTS